MKTSSFIRTTDRLILRPSSEDLAPRVLAFYEKNRADFERTESIEQGNFYTLSYQRTVLRVEKKLTDQGKMVRFWLFPKKDPDLLAGTISFHNIRRGAFFDASLGYKMDASWRRKGLCREAIQAGLRLIFSEYDLHRVTAIVRPDNAPSAALLASLGFKREGLLRGSVHIDGHWQDHYLYALLASDFRPSSTDTKGPGLLFPSGSGS